MEWTDAEVREVERRVNAAIAANLTVDAREVPLAKAREISGVRAVFGDSARTHVNNTKSFIGHCMGAAGSLELAGNLPSFEDGYVHATINVDDLDPACEVRNLVMNQPKRLDRVDHVLNLSFGMLGINSAVLVRRWRGS